VAEGGSIALFDGEGLSEFILWGFSEGVWGGIEGGREGGREGGEEEEEEGCRWRGR